MHLRLILKLDCDIKVSLRWKDRKNLNYTTPDIFRAQNVTQRHLSWISVQWPVSDVYRQIYPILKIEKQKNPSYFSCRNMNTSTSQIIKSSWSVRSHRQSFRLQILCNHAILWRWHKLRRLFHLSRCTYHIDLIGRYLVYKASRHSALTI